MAQRYNGLYSGITNIVKILNVIEKITEKVNRVRGYQRNAQLDSIFAYIY